VASDMALEIIGDVAIVWFLSPQLRLGGSLPSSGFARWTRSLPASAVQVRGARVVQPARLKPVPPRRQRLAALLALPLCRTLFAREPCPCCWTLDRNT